MRLLIKVILLIGCLAVSSAAFAGGPFYSSYSNDGTPMKWKNNKVMWTAESGNLSPRVTNQTAVSWVADLFKVWKDAYIHPTVTADKIYSVSLDIGMAGNVGKDITIDNYKDYVDGKTKLTVIIFDSDGTIINSYLQDENASDHVIGMAAPIGVEKETGNIVFGQVIMNGKFVDGIENNQATRELTDDEFKAAILHELGHLLNMDHAQINVDIADAVMETENSSDKASASQANDIPTMYPIVLSDSQLNPTKDDVVSLAALYPTTAFNNNFCKIHGKIIVGQGNFGFPGVNVVAKNVNSGTTDAHSAVSGSYYELVSATNEVLYKGEQKFGEYTIFGIVPGQQYEVSYEPINEKFVKGSSLEPYGYPNAKPPKDFGTGRIYTADGSEYVSCESGNATVEMMKLKLSADYVSNDLGDVIEGLSPIVDEEETPTQDASGGGGCSLIPEKN